MADAAVLSLAFRPATGARRIVFGRISKDGQLVDAVHPSMVSGCCQELTSRAARVKGVRIAVDGVVLELSGRADLPMLS
jgi:hypothetical protein